MQETHPASMTAAAAGALATRPVVAGGPIDTTGAVRHRYLRSTCSIHVKGVPKAIWRRAREKAIASELAFKHYILKLLEQCESFPPARDANGNEEHDSPGGET